jgi:hypothetical protein
MSVQEFAQDWPPTAEDIKQYLNIKDDSEDANLLVIAEFGQRFVERYTRRLFASESRVYVMDGNGTERMYLPDWPITSVTSVYGPCFDAPRHFVTDGQSVDSDELVSSDDYRIGGNPRDSETLDHLLLIGATNTGLGSTWTLGASLFEITATTGYTEIPNDLYMATIAVISEYWNMFKQGRVGLTSKAVDAGSLAYETTRNLDLHTKSILDRYKRVMV